ncbi:MAG: hypothetical protein WC297_00425 [Candidatus Paceibacterota bacterium]|jgi:hypothetical protein
MAKGKSFLQWLEEGMRAITPDKFVEPAKEIPKGAKVVGEMNEDLKRMCSFLGLQTDLIEKRLEQAGKAFREKLEKAEKEKKPFGMKEIEETFSKEFPASEMTEMKVKLNTLKEVFFASLKAEFDLWEEEIVGVSKGFKVYTAEKEGCNCPFGGIIIAEIHRGGESSGKKDPMAN